MVLIYIGERFYIESKTTMSSIYDINGNRQHWGKVMVALKNGENVYIRQATEKERQLYQKILDEIKADYEKEDKN